MAKAPQRKKRARPKVTRRAKKPPSKRRIWLWRILTLGIAATVIVSIFVAGYLVHLDRTITTEFEGRRWSVPAQVYAQPMELFGGARISQVDLTTELERLGYRADANLRTSGTYRRRDTELEIYLRAFAFMESSRDSARLTISFKGNRISAIRSARKEVPLIRLDPAMIGSFFPAHGEDRIILQPKQVPTLLSEGLKSIEDRSFDKHVGFSVRGIARAFLVNIRSGERRQGASTLTQQLVRSYFLNNDRTITRKLREVAMAFILDARFTKQDLLTAYINEIFIGQSGARAIHGFGLGAQFYFNKPLAELDPDEVAALVAIIRGPSYYNPFRNSERVHERRDRILATWQRDGLISDQQLQQSLAQPLGVAESATSGGAYYPAFMDRVRHELREQYDSGALSSNGLRIFTTIKPQTQESLQSAVSITLSSLESRRGIPAETLQSAAIVADAQTGEIHALVGGRRGRVDGFNRALNASRPVGSLIKPVIYLTALEAGLHLASTVRDETITVQPKFGDPWTPKNFDGKTRGELPMIRALADSLNLATVHLGTNIGLGLIQRRFESLTGIKPKNRYPSFMLGAESLAPIQVLELYGNFASGGFRTPPKAVIAVLDEQGQALTRHPFSLQQSIEPRHAATLNHGLEIVMAKGTGRSSPYARQGVAGKTGTSNDNRDSWFAGFDNSKVSVVWIGNDENKVTGLTGSSGALKVWNAMTADIPVDPLVHLPAYELVDVDYETGLRANPDCAITVKIPIPDPSALPSMPGCRPTEAVGAKLRRWFGG